MLKTQHNAVQYTFSSVWISRSLFSNITCKDSLETDKIILYYTRIKSKSVPDDKHSNTQHVKQNTNNCGNLKYILRTKQKTITLCVCVCRGGGGGGGGGGTFFSVIIFNSVYIWLLCIVALLGRGEWVGAVCILWYECPLVIFSLWELTCLHCVYLALWTRKVFMWKFCMHYIYINFHLFIKLHNIQTQQSKTNANLNFEDIDR